MLDSFPEAFREGMAARADRLGDRGPSAPSNWEPGFDQAHVLVTVSAVDAAHLEAALESVIGEDAEMRAVALVHLQQAEALAGGRDHFGFFDGIAQPAIEGSGVAPRPGDGQPDGAGGWREVATGEVLLGYRDEDGALPAAPAPPFDRNGTFVVYRKLAMDTAAFRRFVADGGLPRRRRSARGQDRRPLGRRHAAGALPRPPGPVGRDQRLLLRERPGRPALPARRPHPPREPARQPRLLRGPALQPPPDRPPRPRLRPAARRRARSTTTASTAA